MTTLPHPSAKSSCCQKYKKKPVVIEAFQYNIIRKGNYRPDWFQDKVSSDDIRTYDSHCEIKTLEGVMRANKGDWIIRGIKGEIYPCKPDIFDATYEPCCISVQSSPDEGGIGSHKHFTTEQCHECGEIFEVHCPRCRVWITNPYVPVIRSLQSRIKQAEEENKNLQEFYDRHHEDSSGDYTAFVDLRPDCECAVCKYSRGIIKHLQDLAQSERDKSHKLRAERDSYRGDAEKAVKALRMHCFWYPLNSDQRQIAEEALSSLSNQYPSSK